MSDYKTIELTVDERGIHTLTLKRGPVNALGKQLVSDLEKALKALATSSARCLILRSGLKHFCAGADLKERKGMNLDDVRAFVPRLAGICNDLANLPFPTIAAVRGAAAGGGCEVALACDIRILADDVKIGLRETALAIIPGAGGTQRLPRLIGPARAKRWIFSGKMHSAAEALADGVADQVVPAADLDQAAEALAVEIAAAGPVAIRLAKCAIEQGSDLPLAEALAVEWHCYQGVLETQDRLEALAAFAEKRIPEFKGR